MPRPSRTRRNLKWTAAVLCVTCVIVWALTLGFTVEFELTSGELWLDADGLAFAGVSYGSKNSLIDVHRHTWRGIPLTRPHLLLGGLGKAPFVLIPHWLVFLLTAIPTAWLWHRDRRLISASPDHRLCLRCGYDLTGNTSGVCPECGDKACPPTGLADSECGLRVARSRQKPSQ